MRLSARLFVLCLVVFGYAAPASAQGVTLGVDGAFVLPQGDLSDITGSQLGAFVRAEVSLLKMIALTARLGYLYGLEKDLGAAKSSLSAIPVMAGLKYFPVTPTPLYVAAEIGLMNATYAYGSAEKDESWTGGTLGAGFQIAGLDLRGQMIVFDLDHMDESYGLMITIGYDFTSLGL